MSPGNSPQAAHIKLIVSVGRIRQCLPAIVVAVSLLGLLVAAVFFYRWINRISELSRRRQQEDLDAAMINLEGSFSGTLQEIIWSFRSIPATSRAGVFPGNYLFESCSKWKTTAKWPQLISDIRFSTKTRDGRFDLWLLNPSTGRVEKTEWPRSLEAFHDILKSPSQPDGLSLQFLPPAFSFFVSEGRLVLTIPLLADIGGKEGLGKPLTFRRDGIVPTSGQGLASQPPDNLLFRRHLDSPRLGRPPTISVRLFAKPQIEGWCFLELNLHSIQAKILPYLVEEYFGKSRLSKYYIEVVAGTPSHILYASDPVVAAKSPSTFDAEIVLFNPRINAGTFYYKRKGMPAPLEMMSPGFAIRWGRAWLGRSTRLLQKNQDDPGGAGAWKLVAKDRFGSIALDVNRVRRRNLAIGFGTLLLLAWSIATLVISAHRAGVLARRQMEFVAGVSHEVRTPLTVIRSAAFNLAKGVVADPARVHQYGEVIQAEARRLSDLVDQTLAFAGAQNGHHQYDLRPTHVLDVVDAALAECKPALSEKGWRIEKTLESDLPLILADTLVLQQVIKNLADNALKYASEGKWLGVRARAVDNWRGKEVQVSIEDHGPGIQRADLPHIFEPFYRGRSVLGSSIPGTGLGLNLVHQHVHAHGGRVSVRTSKESGTSFTLHLPCI